MAIIITQWALDSYLQLRHSNAFTDEEYWGIIRPDVLLLAHNPNHAKFNNDKFWSPATTRALGVIKDGYKMKWHNVGNGRVQLRLPVVSVGDFYLGEAYVKATEAQEQQKLLKFARHIEQIRDGRFTARGTLQ